MKNALAEISILLAVAVTVAAIAYNEGKRAALRGVKPQVVEIVRYDTITAYKPLVLREYERDTIRIVLRDTLTLRDTIVLPRTVREYRDSNYYAVVSGYAPQLDFIQTYERTYWRTETIRIEPPRWSFGIQAGVGLQYGFRGLDFGPYVGVGVQYRFGK